MKVPKELMEQWVAECNRMDMDAITEYIAQRAAEWALSNVSMEPKQQVINDSAEIRRVFEIDEADYPPPDSGFAKL